MNARTLLLVCTAVVQLVSAPATASEMGNPRIAALPFRDPYPPDARVRIGEPSAGVQSVAPERVTVFFDRLTYDLLPSTLELWIDGVEYTEQLRFWSDRAWWQVPPGFTWPDTSHSVVTRIKDTAGTNHQDTMSFDLKPPPPPKYSWLFSSTGEPDVVANIMEDWQDFGGTPYWHLGLDVRAELADTVHAARAGTVVNVSDYGLGGIYRWNVSIEDEDGYIWQYNHIDQTTIAVAENDVVVEGQVLGRLIPWPPPNVNGARYHHTHLNVARWLGGGAIPEPYLDQFEYFNPFNFLVQGAYVDNATPEILDIWFAPNQNPTAFAAASDNTPPVLSGDVDIIVGLRDSMTSIGTLGGQPYDVGVYKLTYQVNALDTDCGVSHVPPTTLARFDKIPGGELIAVQDSFLTRIYQPSFSYNATNFGTSFTYSNREFFYNLTNTRYGSPDAVNGFWDTDFGFFPSIYFPDGDYRVFVFIRDWHGNQTSSQVDVTVDNNRPWAGICPGQILRLAPMGSMHMHTIAGDSAQFIPPPVELSFTDPMQAGSARTTIGSNNWAPWNFDFPSRGFRVAIGVLEANTVEVEYVPYLGDVVLEIHAEAQVLPLPIGGPPPVFDPTAPSSQPVDLRLSHTAGEKPLGRQCTDRFPAPGIGHAVQARCGGYDRPGGRRGDAREVTRRGHRLRVATGGHRRRSGVERAGSRATIVSQPDSLECTNQLLASSKIRGAAGNIRFAGRQSTNPSSWRTVGRPAWF